MTIDLHSLTEHISKDTTLKSSERASLLSALSEDKLRAGLLGGAAGLLISKYLKLSKPSQVLLTLAGFGVGRALLRRMDREPDKFYIRDPKTKTYEIRA